MKSFAFTILLFHITNACIELPAATVHIQNYEGPIYVTPADSRVVTSHPAAHHGNYPTATNLAPCDNRYPTLYSHDNQPLIHNSVPYHQSVCETDCKCVTKQQTCVPVPVNCVPQNTCTPGYYSPLYPEYYGCCPDKNCPETDVSAPRISETLIPLLRTYLSQSGSCPKHCCQCGRKLA